MSFETFMQATHSLQLSGTQLVSLYYLLTSVEDSCPEEQAEILEQLRTRLYEDFTIEELEQLSSRTNYTERAKKYGK